MHESLLHYVWKNALFTTKHYQTSTGEKVEIISPGQYNSDGGPDFLNARVKINDTLWAGNIEIHLKASEWNLHHHQNNPAYNNVILHVVYEDDKPCFTNSGRQLPSISLQIESAIRQNYEKWLNNPNPIRCREELNQVDSSLIYLWLNSLSIERLSHKTQAIIELHKSVANSWEEAFYIHLARSFGLKINTLPFELLAKSLPLKVLAKHSKNLLQIEALLFGQAGLIPESPGDEYSRRLFHEYNFLAKKYQLSPLPPGVWKFLRLRPPNFPTLRIAQFASLVHNSHHLFSNTMHAQNLAELLKKYSCTVSDYWKKHYTFGKVAKKPISGKLGKPTRMLLIINTIVPFMFAYGKHSHNEKIREFAMQLLEEMPAESNSKIKYWREAGIISRHTADSQALLQLTNNYCEPAHCLNCQIGNHLLV